MIFIGLLFSITIALFILFSLSKNDFVLVRKNISLKQIFDGIFICFLGFLFLGRVIFIVLNQQFYLFSPIKFFHLIKFPGVELTGGFIGFFLVAYVLFKKKKTVRRVFDIFALSLVPLVIYFILVTPLPPIYILVKLAMSIFLILLFLLFIWFHKQYLVKDGTITALLGGTVSVFTITILVMQYIFQTQNIQMLYGTALQVVFLVVIVTLTILSRRLKK